MSKSASARPSTSILVVDDEAPMRKVLRLIMEQEGHAVEECGSGAEALELVKRSAPSLVLLDLGLPDIDGLDVAKQIRGLSRVPILVLSVRSDEATIVEALDDGASDYVTKPFREKELLSRVRACLRNAPSGDGRGASGVQLDTARRVAIVGEREVKLSATEQKLLWVLLRAGGSVVTHQALLREVWGATHSGEANSLRVHMHHLREKLEEVPSSPRYLLTEPGVGYRLGSE